MTGMHSVNTNLAVLIANVSGHNIVQKKYDDSDIHSRMKTCQNMIVSIMDKYEGNLVRSTNDQIICTFLSADYAANAAIKMNKVLNTDLTGKEGMGDLDSSVTVHVGIHYGQIIMQDDKEVCGDAMDIASGLAVLAQKDYIFTTGTTVELLSPELQELAYFVKTTVLRRDTENIELFEINWKQVQ